MLDKEFKVALMNALNNISTNSERIADSLEIGLVTIPNMPISHMSALERISVTLDEASIELKADGLVELTEVLKDVLYIDQNNRTTREPVLGILADVIEYLATKVNESNNIK